jgi:hypothetical protein
MMTMISLSRILIVVNTPILEKGYRIIVVFYKLLLDNG